MVRRKAFTLIEAVVVIVALAVAIPPTLSWLDQSVRDRADAVNTSRATTLASAVLEHAVADVASTSLGLGFAALADRDAWLDTPGTGFRDRFRAVFEPYDALGFRYDVEVGPLVSSSGSASGDASRDVYRVLTAVVVFPSAGDGPLTLRIATMVTEL